MSQVRLSRRKFAALLGASLPAAGVFAVGAASTISGATALPPVRAVTRGPRFHWRGYYDKQLFSPTDRFLLANEVDFEHRSPRPGDAIRVGPEPGWPSTRPTTAMAGRST